MDKSNVGQYNDGQDNLRTKVEVLKSPSVGNPMFETPMWEPPSLEI
jgi:hypothetical protein